MTDTEYNAILRSMRQQRTLSPAEVDRRASQHQPLTRYAARQDRTVPSAH